jgi:FkbM family methyltransferase
MGQPSPSREFEDELRVFSLLAEAGFSPHTIYDIGAAVGAWSDMVSTVFPNAEVHLFEPLADLVPNYRENLRVQLEKHSQFKLHSTALGADTGTATMRVHADGVSSTMLNVNHPEYEIKQDVKVNRLDNFVEDFGLPLPDLIKLDTQGSELMILNHAPRCLEQASLVFTETWFDRGYGPQTPLLSEICEFLDRSGFQLAELGFFFYDATHRLYGCDAFFLKKPLLGRLAPLLPWSRW